MPRYSLSWISFLELENEWEQEKRQLLDGLLWGGVALIILGMVLALLCIVAMIGLGWIAVLVALCGGALAGWSWGHLNKQRKTHTPYPTGTA
jgi:hypothetical protein